MESSNILVSDIIEELSSNAKSAALSAGVKLQKIRSSVQRVLQDYKAKSIAVAEVIQNTLTAGTLASPSFNFRAGNATADKVGTVILFSSGISGDYELTCWDDGGQAVPTDTHTATGFTAYPIEDGTTIHYMAMPEV